MINGLQVIVHLPVFDTQFPANANTLLAYLIEVANFELIPPSLLEDVFGTFEETWPLNENFEAIGYETRLVIQNLGSVFLAFIGHLVLFVVLGILWLFLKLYNGERVRKLKEKLEGYLMWNSTMKMLIEASLEISLACFINMDYMYWDTVGLFMCSLFTSVFLIIMSVLNAHLLVSYVNRNQEELDSDEFLERLGVPIEEVETDSIWKIGHKWQFVFRRIVFAFTAVFLRNSFWLQFIILCNISLWELIYLSIV